MPHVIDCSEWRLIQSIGIGISQRKSRFDGSISPRASSTSFRAHAEAELFEVELRRVFLLNKSFQNLPTSQFEEFEAGLRSLCDLLDRIVHPQVCQVTDGLEYPRLRALARHLDTSDQILDLANGPHSTLFKVPENGTEREQSLRAITEYNNSLSRFFMAPLRPTAPIEKDEVQGTWKSTRIRDRASMVLGSVFAHFKCGTSHEIMLKLSDHPKRETISPTLDVMLPLCPDSSQWHEVKCCPHHSVGGISPTLVRDICKDLRQYASQSGGVMLLIKEYELLKTWTPLPQLKASPVCNKKSLNELIEAGAFKRLDQAALASGSSTAPYCTLEKRTLAARLGHCLMDFFDTDLSSKRIHLFGPPTSSLRNSPLYVSFASGLTGKVDSYTFRVGNPALLSFAKLLLEIYMGQVIPLKIGPERDAANRATWAELCDYVDQLVRAEDNTYLQAIRACLMVHCQISEALKLEDEEHVGVQVTVRKELYREVVSKLERGLAELTRRDSHKRRRSESPEPPLKRAYNPTPGGEREVPSSHPYYTRQNAPPRPLGVGPHSGGFDSSVLRRRQTTCEEVRGATDTRHSVSQTAPVPGYSGLFDESTPGTYPDGLCKYADNFMESHKMFYDKAIQRVEAIAPIKVAVLDTGLDLGHPSVKARRERIKDAKTWLPRDKTEGVQDVSGHGTHVTSLLLDIAPDCDVYVAKIADHQPTSPTQIAKAITYATTDWGVDIISMSFGFPDESAPGCDDLREAILRAHASRVLMFAAASNTGAHGAAPAFPARHSNVFCIYSGDGMGNRAPSCPTARTGALNFLALGEAVESAWPLALGSHPWTRRRSGTSFATPVAAGVAAFLLLYAHQELPPGQAGRFREYDKMREWLLHASNERAGYNVISVGNFFSRSAEERKILLAGLLDGRPLVT